MSGIIWCETSRCAAFMFLTCSRSMDKWEPTMKYAARFPLRCSTGRYGEVVRSVSPRLSIVFIRPLEKSIDNSLLRERLIAQLSILFGLLSLLLGCMGLFGIMAYSVGRRTREIGIRIAVGGQPHNVVWSVVSEALLLVVGGLLIGIPMALVLSRYLQSLLFGLTPADGWSIFAVIVTTGLMTLVASVIPARRATRIDPVTALRCE